MMTGDQPPIRRRIYFDLEFTGLHQHTTLISIAMLTDHGYSFYAEANDYDPAQVDAWLRENVLSHLYFADRDTAVAPRDSIYPVHYSMKDSRDRIAIALRKWLAQWESVEIWGDVLAYDWVLFCGLFGGGAECLPRNVYYIPFDLATLLRVKGYDPDIRREELAGPVVGPRHHAMRDAAVIGLCVKQLLGGEG